MTGTTKNCYRSSDFYYLAFLSPDVIIGTFEQDFFCRIMDMFIKPFFIIGLIYIILDLSAQNSDPIGPTEYPGEKIENYCSDDQHLPIAEERQSEQIKPVESAIFDPDYKAVLMNLPNTGNSYRHEMFKRKTGPPWLLISAVPFVTGGIAAHFRTKELHSEYLRSVSTDEAVNLRHDVEQMQLLRNISFGVAGVLGITGIVFHKKRFLKNKRVNLRYLPFALGGSLDVTF